MLRSREVRIKGARSAIYEATHSRVLTNLKTSDKNNK